MIIQVFYVFLQHSCHYEKMIYVFMSSNTGLRKYFINDLFFLTSVSAREKSNFPHVCFIACESEFPHVLKSDFPHVLKSDFPHVLKSDFPHVLKSDFPHVLKSEFPHVLKSEFPHVLKSDFPHFLKTEF